MFQSVYLVFITFNDFSNAHTHTVTDGRSVRRSEAAMN